ncbi:uncharacterized protein sS8_5502 [Methylocaldum marinum]|uniref:Cytochrome P460 domain-containing protein n=1 Tax=Methylocaldum marinum TaxID=1432792 RepID=A0A250L3K5_9GAMM|nr:cytochrome P460 family protein [Methylocaldum marinum]BBA37419.1 uncharacterized protein sS8_5502 [Methylocaldum marinum]
MKKHIVISLSIGIGLNLVLAGTTWSEEAKVTYPEGYRDWTHVKSMVIQPGHSLYDSFGGIHHIYVNDKGRNVMIEGGSYPDGAVLIFDLLEAKSENNAIVEGKRKVLGVMEKDSKKYKDTGGWGFEGFKGDTRERVVTDAKSACFSCHEPQKQSDYVFSTYRK